MRLSKERKKMDTLFPKAITDLPLAEIPLEGVKAYLSQSEGHQILFMQFEKDVHLPEHSHAEQVGFVLEGRIELTLNNEKHLYRKGDRYFIPSGVNHSARIYAGYADITFFNEARRYEAKKGT